MFVSSRFVSSCGTDSPGACRSAVRSAGWCRARFRAHSISEVNLAEMSACGTIRSKP